MIAICTLVLSVFGIACKKDTGDNSSDVGGETSALEFVEKRLEMLLGESRQLSLSALQEDENVSYHSNDENIVTVNGQGLATAQGIGTTVVKATTSKERTALMQIVVHDPQSYPVPYFILEKDAISLSVGDNYALSYSLAYMGEKIEGAVSFSVDNSAIATVENGVIKALSAGSATVTLQANTSVGVALKQIQVTVSEKEAEFSVSFAGKEIYVGKRMEMQVYVNENGVATQLDGVTFTAKESGIVAINGNEMLPEKGGDVIILAEFDYKGQSFALETSVHVYGAHSCTFTYLSGEVDHVVEAVYGDTISLALENSDNNPEYNKEIKCWYVNGEEVADGMFVMPDKDVEVSVRFVGETKENFTDSFTNGHLFSDVAGKVSYVSQPFADAHGNLSDGGYVKMGTNWASVNFYFDEWVTVNDFSVLRMRIYMPKDSLLLYFGVPTEENWKQGNSTKRYEASEGVHLTGDVPLALIEEGKWLTLELPLSAFVSVGEDLNGISMAIAKDYLLIDWISVSYGLAANDPNYQDTALYKAIQAEQNGSDAQMKAIENYRVWTNSISSEFKAGKTHQDNAAAINAIIREYFAEARTSKTNNVPTVQGGVMTGNQAGGPYCHPDGYVTEGYESFYMTQVGSAPYSGTYSFAKLNYNAYTEVSFGFYVISTHGGTVIVGDKTLEFNNPVGDYMKVIIKDGTLTLRYDESGNDAQLCSYALSEEILNGTQALSFTFAFTQSTDGSTTYGQIENTEMDLSITVEEIA